MAQPGTGPRGFGRRTFIRAAGGAGLGFVLFARLPGGVARALAELPGGTLDPADVHKFVTPLLVPPVMPRAGTRAQRGGRSVDYYEISVRQLRQQILPAGMPDTPVWGYGAVRAESPRGLLLHHAPSLTIEARWNRPVRVKWLNELVDASGHFLPHLLPVDPTLHWANPPGGRSGRDSRPSFDHTPGPYRGPVPVVTHVHGAVNVGDESDGYSEAWFLPDADNIPPGYARVGTWYPFFAHKAATKFGVHWGSGFATFQYPNSFRAATTWYHDHALGLTRLNVYAGPAGFYLIRGGPSDDVRDSRTGSRAVLPGPAPRAGDELGSSKRYREIPIAIQDRAFNTDGSLFYPDTRAFFDQITGPYRPAGPFPPIWNPEFFGNTVVVNGNTWPFHTVEQRRYRFRVLNGCQARFLILDFSRIPGVQVWQIGNEGGFLDRPVNLTAATGNRLPMGPAERADLEVDFAHVPVGPHVLHNLGPDEPYGGGAPGVDFTPADPQTTGQIMQFRVVPASGADRTTPPGFLALPPLERQHRARRRRRLALVEEAATGRTPQGTAEGPVAALLGLVKNGVTVDKRWMDPVTENPAVDTAEIWEFFNTTVDAHPIHVHETAFAVVNRQRLTLDPDGSVVQPIRLDGPVLPPEPWEHGFKDTVAALPGHVTRVRADFDVAGQYVWHCHIVEHEDNEMMRPYRIGPEQSGQPE
ncbi:MAG TPA: multicopper oxidase [Nocardioidaceae bacterium]|nr:multicopper oxidase [Nocardioidaceae bacterium]